MRLKSLQPGNKFITQLNASAEKTNVLMLVKRSEGSSLRVVDVPTGKDITHLFNPDTTVILLNI